jgi:asparagine synthase (glutamine-hydrolysing)
MCGIFGTLDVDGSRAEAAAAAARVAMAHRGPDASGVLRVDGATRTYATAHTRLSIIDLSPGGAQPMRSGDGRYTLTFNGEIFNFAVLRAELEVEGERFASRSDTEVLLRALVRWGTPAITRLRGFFAFALHDRLDGSLLLVRDRLGIKPLLVARRAGRLSYASEVRTLMAAEVAERRLDLEAVASYLATGSVSEPRTILQGVEQLPAGTWLRVGPQGEQLERYWDIPTHGTYRIHTFGEAVEAVGAELRRAVRMRLVSDVPLGIFLSGGLDSSVMLAMAAEASSQPVRSFTVGFEQKLLDESDYAELVASTFGARHQHIPLSADRAAAEVDGAVAALDQPSADGLNTYFVSKATREAGITVALSGLGGDELFAGYPHFRTFGQISRRPHLLRLGGVLDRLGPSTPGFGTGQRWLKLREIARSGGDPLVLYGVLRAMFVPSQISTLLRSAAVRPPAAAAPEGFGPALVEADPVNAFGALELSNYLRNTLLRDTDVMSMANALEVRPPLLDHKVVELAMGIPGRLKVEGTFNKALLAATTPALPAATVGRKKMGFTLPFDAWFRGALRPWMEARLLGEPLARLGILDGGAAAEAWGGFLRGERYVSHARVWCLAVLVDWCERHKVSL